MEKNYFLIINIRFLKNKVKILKFLSLFFLLCLEKRCSFFSK
ncbi:hypothetical protein RV06_GL001046 [Enterococcus haemoperoxidus]|nr:hypothetical protein RV06_GL001046 [Enterococcus haemoperoxidus]